MGAKFVIYDASEGVGVDLIFWRARGNDARVPSQALLFAHRHRSTRALLNDEWHVRGEPERDHKLNLKYIFFHMKE